MKLTKENVHNALNDWTEKDNAMKAQPYHKATFKERCRADKYVYAILLILVIITAIWIS